MKFVSDDATLHSGSRRRAVLVANPATCDVCVHGADGRLRLYNPKAVGPMRCVQQLRPQLLSEAFVQSAPGFWQAPPHEQERHVREILGADPAALDMPHEIVELKLHEAGGLLAMVEMEGDVAGGGPSLQHVSVATLPPAARAPGPPGEVDALLLRLGLGEYASSLRERGYVSLKALVGMSSTERETLTYEISMAPGHAHTLTMCPAPTDPAPARARARPAARAPCRPRPQVPRRPSSCPIADRAGHDSR